jgi:enoyl-CoA hydratase/carnithine racemase
VPRGQALAEAVGLAQEFAANDPQTVRAVKRIAQAAIRLDPAEAMRHEREAFPDLWAAPAHLRASAAFVAKRNHQPRTV